jgi:hypothetical protein
LALHKHTNWYSIAGRMSSSARTPTVECRLSKVFAAACLTSGRGSQSAFLTVGTKLFTNVSTMSLLVEAIISDRPIHTPCRWSGWSDSRPFSRMGMISGSTRSPNFLTKSPNVRAATCRKKTRVLLKFLTTCRLTFERHHHVALTYVHSEGSRHWKVTVHFILHAASTSWMNVNDK